MSHHPQLDADLVIRDMAHRIADLEAEVARLKVALMEARGMKVFYVSEKNDEYPSSDKLDKHGRRIPPGCHDPDDPSWP